MALRARQGLFLYLTAVAPLSPLAAQIDAAKFVNHPVPGVVGNNQTTKAPPGMVPGAVAAAPCSEAAIHIAADQHVAPALKTCTLATIQPYLNAFFKPAPPIVDVSDPAAVGIIVDQRPDPGAAVGDVALVVYVGAIVQPPTPKPEPKVNPKHDPKASQQDDPTTVVPAVQPHSMPEEPTIYPWWVWPSAAGLAIVAIVGLGWLIFHKRPDPIPLPDSIPLPDPIPVPTPVPPAPRIGCDMESERLIIDRRDVLAETPHLTIAVAFAPGVPRASPITIMHKEILS